MISWVGARVFWAISLLGAFALVGTGCDSIRSWEGTYQGFFQLWRGNTIDKQRIRLQAIVYDRKTMLLRSFNEEGRPLYQIAIRDQGRGSISVDLSPLGLPPTLLSSQ